MEAAGSTVLWRLFRPASRDRVRAVVLPGGPPFTLAFFANDDMDRVENYETMELALFRADEIKRSLLDEDWKDD
jgi:hypothetical protein